MPKRKKEEDQILLDVTDCGIKGAATLRISHGKYNKKRGTLYTAYLCNSDNKALLLDAGLKKKFKRVQKRKSGRVKKNIFARRARLIRESAGVKVLLYGYIFVLR